MVCWSSWFGSARVTAFMKDTRGLSMFSSHAALRRRRPYRHVKCALSKRAETSKRVLLRRCRGQGVGANAAERLPSVGLFMMEAAHISSNL